jgi:hypothetical protein
MMGLTGRYQMAAPLNFLEEELTIVLVQLSNIVVKGESAHQLSLAQNKLVSALQAIGQLKTKQDSKELPTVKDKISGHYPRNMPASSKRVSSSDAF